MIMFAPKATIYIFLNFSCGMVVILEKIIRKSSGINVLSFDIVFSLMYKF